MSRRVTPLDLGGIIALMNRALLFSLVSASLASAAPIKFDFRGNAPVNAFNRERGSGFEIGAIPKCMEGFITADGPFLFSVLVPEGNYDVTVTLGDPKGVSNNTIKAESRRLMLENIVTAQGQQVTKIFTVNVHRPDIAGGSHVKLKDREKDCLHWDDKLTLEFNGSRPCISRLEITPAAEAPTIFLLGDSTVTDQPYEPWNSWGQMFTRFFKPGIAVANFAESGESLRSSLGANRVAKVESMLKKGDYVFVQFGHNDMKDKREDALPQYEKNLTALVKSVRAKGATPVLVTSMERKAGVTKSTHGDYPDTVKRVAAAENAPLVDLHAMSQTLYAGLGKHLNSAFQDGTHHNNFGSYEIAKCVVEGVRKGVPELAKHIADDVKPFDPSKPDDPAAFKMPASPMKDPTKPDGN